MTEMDKKVEHVRQATQTRPHLCHWPGCTQTVPPAKWGCYYHWYKVPSEIRRRLWKAYRVGQEEDLNPSKEYLKAADDLQEWIKQHEAKKKTSR